MSILRPKIKKDGQAYYDDPVYVAPKREQRDRLSEAVAEVYGGPGWQPKAPIIVRHERVRLRWMKPDGKGGLVPR